MAFKKASDILRENGAKFKGPNSTGLPGIYLGSAAGSKGSFHITFRISADVAKEARLQEGDRMALDVDREAGLLLIRRVPAGSSEQSWALSRSGGSKAQGTPSSYKFQFSWVKGLPSVLKSVKCEHEITREGIMLCVPEDADWDENIRLRVA